MATKAALGRLEFEATQRLSAAIQRLSAALDIAPDAPPAVRFADHEYRRVVGLGALASTLERVADAVDQLHATAQKVTEAEAAPVRSGRPKSKG